MKKISNNNKNNKNNKGKKDEEENNVENMIPLQICGIRNTNNMTIKQATFTNKNNKYLDEELYMNDDVMIKNLFGNIFVKFFKCKLPINYILENKKLPMLYASIYYEKTLVKGKLFDLYLYFENKEQIKINDLYHNKKSEFEGRYVIELLMDVEREILVLENFQGQNNTINLILELLNNEYMINIINDEMKNRDDERIKKFGNLNLEQPNLPK